MVGHQIGAKNNMASLSMTLAAAGTAAVVAVTLYFRLRRKSKPKKLLILDVNGLLVSRVFNPKLDQELPDYPHVQRGEFSIFLRPHCQEFTKWCSSRFVVVVWSGAQVQNVKPMIELAYATGTERPVAILDQSHCTETGVCHPQKPAKKLMQKTMSFVWALPEVREAGPFGENDTLMLDDSPYKALSNPENTALHPLEWSPETKDLAIINGIGPDGEVRRMLERFADAEDGRAIVCAHNATKHALWGKPEDDPLYDLVKQEFSKRA